MSPKYVITDFDIMPDSSELQTQKIQSVFDMCKDSGGTVVIPKGEYHTGALRMWSDTTLILEDGSRLVGSDICENYEIFDIPDNIKMRSDMEMITSYFGKPWSAYRRAIITVYGGKNIRIIGCGNAVIDGSDCCDPNGEEGFRGPHGIFISSVEKAELAGYTICNCGNFMHEINNSTDIHISGVTCLGGSDGVHMHESKNILIENCTFHTGDDCIAGINMKDLTVRNCDLNTSCDIFRAGGNNILIENCHMWGPGIFPHRMSVVQNRGTELVRDKRNTLPQTEGRHNLIFVWVHFASEKYSAQKPYGNIIFRNCLIENPEAFMEYDPEAIIQKGAYISDIKLENVEIRNVKRLSGLHPTKEHPMLAEIINCSVTTSDGNKTDTPFRKGTEWLRQKISE